MTDNPGGKYRNYDYGYIPKDEKIPEGWVRTLRPCMECNSSVTYIDKDKTWHCLKCGWSCSVDDTHVSASIENTADSGKENKDSEIREEEENGMALLYSDHDFEMVKKGLEQGKTVAAISASIGRGTDALNHKIKVWREEGRLPKGKGRKRELPEQKGVLTVDTDSPIVDTIPPVDFPEFTAEYVKDLQAKLKDANNRIKDMEARIQDANDLAYQFEEQVLDLQTQLKSQQDYIHTLEEVAASVIPDIPTEPLRLKERLDDIEGKVNAMWQTVSNAELTVPKDTPHTRLCNALQKAEEAGMELRNINVCGMYAHFEFGLGLVGGVKPEGESIKDDEIELPF